MHMKYHLRIVIYLHNTDAFITCIKHVAIYVLSIFNEYTFLYTFHLVYKFKLNGIAPFRVPTYFCLVFSAH